MHADRDIISAGGVGYGHVHVQMKQVIVHLTPDDTIIQSTCSDMTISHVSYWLALIRMTSTPSTRHGV